MFDRSKETSDIPAFVGLAARSVHTYLVSNATNQIMAAHVCNEPGCQTDRRRDEFGLDDNVIS